MWENAEEFGAALVFAEHRFCKYTQAQSHHTLISREISDRLWSQTAIRNPSPTGPISA